MFSKSARPIDNKRELIDFLVSKRLDVDTNQIKFSQDNLSFLIRGVNWGVEQLKQYLYMFVEKSCKTTFFVNKKGEIEVSLQWDTLEEIIDTKKTKIRITEVTDEEVWEWLMWHHNNCPEKIKNVQKRVNNKSS